MRIVKIFTKDWRIVTSVRLVYIHVHAKPHHLYNIQEILLDIKNKYKFVLLILHVCYVKCFNVLTLYKLIIMGGLTVWLEEAEAPHPQKKFINLQG